MLHSSQLPRQLFALCKRGLHTSLPRLSVNNVPISRTRNIGIIAHIDAGKTTTTERMLFYSGKTNRIGNVDDGDTVTDYLPSERQRGITIQSAAITIPWNHSKINIIDTPGHADFTFEVIRSLRVLDGAVTILDGVAGVEAQTEKVWKQAAELGIPRITYINKMDRDGAGFSRTVKDIIQKLQTRVVLCNVPFFETKDDGSPAFAGVVDVLHKYLLRWDPKLDADGRDIVVTDIAAEQEKYPELFEMLKKSRESMVETLSELDEAVIESFFEHDEDYMSIPDSVLDGAIKRATIANKVTPVFCGSSFRNIGVQPLMDGVVKYLPSPLETKLPVVSSITSKRKGKKKKEQVSQISTIPVEMDSEKGLVVNKTKNLTVALAFKVMTHATRGVMTFFRVYSGKLNANSTVVNTRTGKKLHLRNLLIMHGDTPENVQHVSAGNIGVISGLEDELVTGDTLVAHATTGSKNFSELESNLKMMPIEIPPPLFNSSLEPSTAGDYRHMLQCIKILEREDPSIMVNVDEDMGQTIISGMGELHLEIVKERLVKDMKANVRLTDIAVSYKESLTRPPLQSIKVVSSESDDIWVEVELDSFEGVAEETDFADEDGAIVMEQENNIYIIPNLASPNLLKALEDRRWKLEQSLEYLQDTLVQGCVTGLQLGGPILGLPFHSVVVRIKGWSFPVDISAAPTSSLLDIGRRAVTKLVDEEFQRNKETFTMLEPIMKTKVYVNSDVLGEVVHDLTHKGNAVISSIDDQAGQDLDAMSWANEEAEKVYLPPDYTMKSKAYSEINNQKIITAETPLREMIGYVSRLRSMTQGRGVFDMSFLEMRRAYKTRLAIIANQL